MRAVWEQIELITTVDGVTLSQRQPERLYSERTARIHVPERQLDSLIDELKRARAELRTQPLGDGQEGGGHA